MLPTTHGKIIMSDSRTNSYTVLQQYSEQILTIIFSITLIQKYIYKVFYFLQVALSKVLYALAMFLMHFGEPIYFILHHFVNFITFCDQHTLQNIRR
jgi:hypothetical protein